ncbi:hypothetical protein [Sorangium sp. So ce341]
MSADVVPPIRRSLLVPRSRAGAFDLFVRPLADRWPLAARSVGRPGGCDA